MTKLLTSPSYSKSNLLPEERIALKNLSQRDDIVINSADKGGKTVIMEKKDYVSACEKDLDNEIYYQKLTEDPSESVAQEIEVLINGMIQKSYITDQEAIFLSSNLKDSRMPIFYGLPKIHKCFTHFPPLRPIVSQIGSLPYTISKYVDSFLK